MTLVRFGLALALAVGVCGCAVGGPQRASDIQNLNAISDDISAVSMTQSDSSRVHDPNLHSTLPRTYETSDTH
ncbi:MAG TPA: hypothetical protein VNF04_07335 [Stellaceae bacterium]|nr:hypothetical protein [Stellaceae bacterium]